MIGLCKGSDDPPAADQPADVHRLPAASNRIFEASRTSGFDDVTIAQSRLLMGVDPDGTRLSVLAARAQIAKQTATALVDKLERAGYVERVPDPSDGRARLVRMTPRAEAIPYARAEEDRIEAEWSEHRAPPAWPSSVTRSRRCVRSPTPTGDATLCGVDISARTEYAVRAMLALARAQAEGAGPLSVETLAQRQDLPRKFLEAIVADLRGAELVVSTRGAKGGYALARPASGDQSR